jgi:hypothetical protein
VWLFSERACEVLKFVNFRCIFVFLAHKLMICWFDTFKGLNVLCTKRKHDNWWCSGGYYSNNYFKKRQRQTIIAGNNMWYNLKAGFKKSLPIDVEEGLKRIPRCTLRIPSRWCLFELATSLGKSIKDLWHVYLGGGVCRSCVAIWVEVLAWYSMLEVVAWSAMLDGSSGTTGRKTNASCYCSSKMTW